MPQTTGTPVPSSSQLAKPMPASRRIPASPADRALAMIARILAKDGYSLSVPSWDGHAYLRISNALQAHTELTITPHCDITWEYRSSRYPHTSEHRLTATAIELLDPGHTQPLPAPPPEPRNLTPLGAIRHALAGHGLTTTMTDTGAGVLLAAANPAQPCRGTILISGDGELKWTIHTPRHPDGGIPLGDIAAAITRALARADHPAIRDQHEEPA
jgi:hypothetical protein